MQDDSPKPPYPHNSAGYRPLIPPDLNKGVGPAAFGFVAAAAGLGIALGVTGAMLSSHARVAAAPSVSAHLNTPSASLAMLPAAYRGGVPSLLSKVEAQSKPAVTSSLLMRAGDKSASKRAGKHKRHGIHKLLDWKKGSHRHKGEFRKPYVSADPPAPVDEPTALQLANAAAASGPFFLGIQGDVTVANFDATTGTIQTYEGETYLLARNNSEGGAIPWKDYPFNVHYRCDEVGNCTLSHAGASAIAKLTR